MPLYNNGNVYMSKIENNQSIGENLITVICLKNSMTRWDFGSSE